ncbi:hypothetical protein CHS0354_019291 [Potamilus streckersoni]|uniref:Superoxide dismutase copper/zinc binding domain-containing protein n=1 Tax=Potamilus streckersoni TaxID=2493646 RepID=A0AAE0VVW2_9BIVA|nr:hypothetical protein CHS0354_019291 [Potamilus streckersoni]
MTYEVIKTVLVTVAVSFLIVDGTNPTSRPGGINYTHYESCLGNRNPLIARRYAAICKEFDITSIALPLSVGVQCNLQKNPSLKGVSYQIGGTVSFRQTVTWDCRRRMSLVEITTKITGLPTNDGTTNHGIHVHESIDLRNGCESMGPHFNPLNSPPGATHNALEMRHGGDFGNRHKYDNQTSQGYINDIRYDNLLNLVGNHSIIGRGLLKAQPNHQPATHRKKHSSKTVLESVQKMDKNNKAESASIAQKLKPYNISPTAAPHISQNALNYIDPDNT